MLLRVNKVGAMFTVKIGYNALAIERSAQLKRNTVGTHSRALAFCSPDACLSLLTRYATLNLRGSSAPIPEPYPSTAQPRLPKWRDALRGDISYARRLI